MRRVAFVLLVLAAAAAASREQPQCRFEFTSLALLSCQETSPQKPTRSCCDALLYAIDVYPASGGDTPGGICCLCDYLLRKHPGFDLNAAYVTCGGKDAASVAAWMRRRPAAGPLNDCDAQCATGNYRGEDAPPPPPKKKGELSTVAIAAIIVSVLVGVSLISYILYRASRSAVKKRTSPDPSVRQQQDDDGGGGGVEMTTSGGRRTSSARSSSSRLL